jgi:exonuclease VII small subunit
MTKKEDRKTEPDFKALQQELDDITQWFESNDDIDPSIALEKYRRSVQIVKTLKSYLSGIENEFKIISQELEDETN